MIQRGYLGIGAGWYGATEKPAAVEAASRRLTHVSILLLAWAAAYFGVSTARSDGGFSVGFNSFVLLASFQNLPVVDHGLFLRLPPVAETLKSQVIPLRERTEIVEHKVIPGDTLGEVAERYSLRLETLLWSNDLEDANLLQVGDTLLIPPLDGVIHTVKAGDTLAALATKYKVETEAILHYPLNQLADPEALSVGQRLVVPGGRKPFVPRLVPPSRGQVRLPLQVNNTSVPSVAGFSWPTHGPIYTYFSPYHTGVDISPPYGTPVHAAAPGVVIDAKKLGWGYGWYLIVDHGGGVSTMYAHLGAFLVDVGEEVSRGQVIGRVGNTGRTTGPHLHFELHLNGRPLNPLSYLP